jgi:hypothetical protein
MEDGYDAVNMARALDLAAGRPLDPLPPAAFELRRGGRSAPSDAPDDDPGADAEDEATDPVAADPATAAPRA